MNFNLSDEELKMILEILNTIAIIAASLVAIYGINAWRKEFQGKRKIKLAEDVLSLFYEAKDAIRAMRSPFGYQGEGETRKPKVGETPQQKKAWDRAYVVYERFEKRQEVFNKLHSKRYQFMARFGREKSKPFEDLRLIVNEIHISATQLAHIWGSNRISKDTEKERTRHESVIYDFGGDDAIANRLEKVISDIE